MAKSNYLPSPPQKKIKNINMTFQNASIQIRKLARFIFHRVGAPSYDRVEAAVLSITKRVQVIMLNITLQPLW